MPETSLLNAVWRPSALAIVAILGAGLPAGAETHRFDTPLAAADALISAVASGEREQILGVLGAEAEDIVFTGDEAADADAMERFGAAAATLRRVVVDDAAGSATLYLGETQWPVPLPIIRTETGWAFDAAAAREEILIRRIGANERDVIALGAEYVRAQLEYRSRDRDGDGVHEFAQHVLSAPDSRDGLYWPADETDEQSPFGPLLAMAAASGYLADGSLAEPEPYHGYVYRILTGQGEEAPGGLYSYVVNGNMVAGHALLAYPAAYGATGVMSFMIGEDGTVFEADLGEATAEVAAEIELYDPDARWRPVALP